MTSSDLNQINTIICNRFGLERKENANDKTEIQAICTDLIIKSWWASWLPFGWMHSLAAKYFANKATRIYNAQKEPV